MLVRARIMQDQFYNTLTQSGLEAARERDRQRLAEYIYEEAFVNNRDSLISQIEGLMPLAVDESYFSDSPFIQTTCAFDIYTNITPIKQKSVGEPHSWGI